jgi:hypothetical protein
LKIKADPRLETGDYRVLMYRPGILFNEETMLTYPGSRVQGRDIGLCIQAALFHKDDLLLEAVTSHTATKAVVLPEGV